MIITSLLCLLFTLLSYVVKDSQRWDDILKVICYISIIVLLSISYIMELCYLIKKNKILKVNKKIILYLLISVLAFVFIIYSSINSIFVDSFLGTLVVLLMHLQINYQIDLIESQ